MTGIYVITYKAGGFMQKHGHFCDYIQRKGGFCKKHAMLAPDGRARRSDSGLARAKRAFSQVGSFLPRFRKILIVFRTKS